MTRTAFITHPDCWLHEMGAGHPESPARLTAIRDELTRTGHLSVLDCREAPAATREQIERVHLSAYVDEIFEAAPVRGVVPLDADTSMNPHSLGAALHAAGAGVLATDLVMRGEIVNAFCAVRPPGHHAERGRAMGFCLFNNVAVAARHALDVHGLERVAIIDFDVHHGNGTENIFVDDARVEMLGFFQYPLYPYCGVEPLGDNMHNTPLPSGTRGDAVRDLVEREWLPRLLEFQPQMLFISAGFDAHREDQLASMALDDEDYAWITRKLAEFAREHCAGRIISVLEGGYALDALARSATLHIGALAGI